MEQLKHECGVAMIRLLKPLEYYEKKYGTWMYGLNKLYLLMEKQTAYDHNSFHGSSTSPFSYSFCKLIIIPSFACCQVSPP